MGEEKILRKCDAQVLVNRYGDSVRNSTSAPFSRSNSTQSASDTMQAQCKGFSVPWVQFTSAPCGGRKLQSVRSAPLMRQDRTQWGGGGQGVLTLTLL